MQLLGHNLRISQGEIWNWPLWMEARRDETGRPVRWLGGSFSKQGDLYMMLGLRGHKMNRFPHTEAFTGFSHIHRQDSLINTLLFQGCILETGSSYGKSRQNIYTFQRQGRGWEGDESAFAPPMSQCNWQFVLSMTSPKKLSFLSSFYHLTYPLLPQCILSS